MLLVSVSGRGQWHSKSYDVIYLYESPHHGENAFATRSKGMCRTSRQRRRRLRPSLLRLLAMVKGGVELCGGQSGTIYTSGPAQAQANLPRRILLLSSPLPEFHSSPPVASSTNTHLNICHLYLCH